MFVVYIIIYIIIYYYIIRYYYILSYKTIYIYNIYIIYTYYDIIIILLYIIIYLYTYLYIYVYIYSDMLVGTPGFTGSNRNIMKNKCLIFAGTIPKTALRPQRLWDPQLSRCSRASACGMDRTKNMGKNTWKNMWHAEFLLESWRVFGGIRNWISDDDAKFERSFVWDQQNSPNMDSSNGHTLP